MPIDLGSRVLGTLAAAARPTLDVLDCVRGALETSVLADRADHIPFEMHLPVLRQRVAAPEAAAALVATERVHLIVRVSAVLTASSERHAVDAASAVDTAGPPLVPGEPGFVHALAAA